jgi:hypothetical protein
VFPAQILREEKMSYIVVRFYAPTGDLHAEELSQRAGKEIVPHLLKTGCQRYTTIKFLNGHVGSVSFYPDKAAADRAAEIAIEWAKGTGGVQGLARTLRGEQVFSHHNQESHSLANTFGVIRIYGSAAPAEDVKAALELEATPIIRNADGSLRYTCFRSDDGDNFVVLTAHTTRESATQLTAQARDAVKNGSRLQKVFPHPPEVIEGDIIQSYAS